jgi:hypothetical protein
MQQNDLLTYIKSNKKYSVIQHFNQEKHLFYNAYKKILKLKPYITTC